MPPPCGVNTDVKYTSEWAVSRHYFPPFVLLVSQQEVKSSSPNYFMGPHYKQPSFTLFLVQQQRRHKHLTGVGGGGGCPRWGCVGRWVGYIGKKNLRIRIRTGKYLISLARRSIARQTFFLEGGGRQTLSGYLPLSPLKIAPLQYFFIQFMFCTYL